jgi:hypothetical protein
MLGASRGRGSSLTFGERKMPPMTTTNPSEEIAGGFVLAGFTLCLGVYFGVKAGEEGGAALMRLFYGVAALIVLKYTFAWGCHRGFPAKREDGSIVVSHVLRNLTMAALVWGLLLFVFGPVATIALHFAQ